MKKSIQFLITSAAIAGLAVSVYALPSDLVVSDGTAPDTFSVAGNAGGTATFAGTVGTWFLTVDTGISYPASGGPTNPNMDLNFDANGSGTLYITWTDAFGPLSAQSLLATIGGTLGPDASMWYNVFQDPSLDSNGLPTGTPIASQMFNSTPFSGAWAVPILGADSTDLVQEIVISADVSGTDSGDSTLGVPDSGMTAILVALGLAGIAVGAATQRRSLPAKR